MTEPAEFALPDLPELTIEEWRKRYVDPYPAMMCRVADLAGVPPEMRNKFYRYFGAFLRRQADDHLYWAISAVDRDKAFVDAERAIRAAKRAIDKLSEGQRALLHIAMIPADKSLRWPHTTKPAVYMTIMAAGFAKITRKNPELLPAPGRRRPKGTVTNFPFHNLIKNLFVLTAYCGGRLPFDKKKGGGGRAFRDALEAIKPFVPPGVIPKIPSLSTIARIRKSCTQ